MELYYLIYSSVPARPMNDDELKELLHVSREANLKYSVTGMLIYLPEMFMQLIEGQRAHIEQLYQNIRKDSRHFQVNTVREGPIDQRFFPDWTMAFKQDDTGRGDIDILALEDKKVWQIFDILDA